MLVFLTLKPEFTEEKNDVRHNHILKYSKQGVKRMENKKLTGIIHFQVSYPI